MGLFVGSKIRRPLPIATFTLKFFYLFFVGLLHSLYIYLWAWFLLWSLVPAWIRRACFVLLLALVPGSGPGSGPGSIPGLTFGPLDLWTFGPLDLDPWTWTAGTIPTLTIA